MSSSPAKFILDKQVVTDDIPAMAKKPFENDLRCQEKNYSDAEVYNGEPKMFKLDPSFLDYMSIQPQEDYIGLDFLFLSEEENKQIHSLPKQNEREKAFRRAVRARYPLRVMLQPGVLYSALGKVIISGSGDIDHVLQQKIDPVLIFKNYECTLPRANTSKKAIEMTNGLRDISSQNTEWMLDSDTDTVDRVQRHFAPLQGISNEDDTKRQAYAGPSRPRSLSWSSSPSRPSTPAPSAPPASPVLEDIVKSTTLDGKRLVFPFFTGRELASTGIITSQKIDPFNRSSQEGGPSLVKLISTGKKFFRESRGIRAVGSINMGYTFWFPDNEDSRGKPPVTFINLFKVKNALAGACINMTITEAQHLMVNLAELIVEATDGFSDHAFNQEMLKVNALKAENNFEDADRFEAFALTNLGNRKESVAARSNVLFDQ